MRKTAQGGRSREKENEGGGGGERAWALCDGPLQPKRPPRTIENTQLQPGGRSKERREEEDRGRPIAMNWGVHPGRKTPAFLITLGKPRREEERTGRTRRRMRSSLQAGAWQNHLI